jgi:hypothetical protein
MHGTASVGYRSGIPTVMRPCPFTVPRHLSLSHRNAVVGIGLPSFRPIAATSAREPYVSARGIKRDFEISDSTLRPTNGPPRAD